MPVSQNGFENQTRKHIENTWQSPGMEYAPNKWQLLLLQKVAAQTTFSAKYSTEPNEQ